MPAMKILIVDDHSVVREGVAALLLSGFAGSCVLEAHDCARGLDIVDEHADLDIVVLDLGLPGMGGMSAIPEFGRRRPNSGMADMPPMPGRPRSSTTMSRSACSSTMSRPRAQSWASSTHDPANPLSSRAATPSRTTE